MTREPRRRDLIVTPKHHLLAHTAAGTGAVFAMQVIARGAIGHGVGAAA